MPFHHEAVAALPVTGSASKALVRAMATGRFAYCLAGSESSSDFVAVDPDAGTVPPYLVQNSVLFQYDPRDTTSTADDLTCLVTSDGKRYKAADISYFIGLLALSDLLGTLTPDQLPLPTASTLGGMKALAQVAHNWINSIGTDGVPVASRPAASDLSNGTMGTGQVVLASVIDTDVALTANSDTRIASQKAIKNYSDQIIAAADAMVFKGVVDCSANPNYPAADRGWTYKVSVAGKIGGASGVAVEVGDTLFCITDGTASGNQATVGSAWNIVQVNTVGAVIGPSSATDKAAARFDLTTGALLKNSPLLIADTTGALSRSGGGGIPIQGSNTSSTAAAGDVGEYISSTVTAASAISLSNSAAKDVTFIDVPAGNWELEGIVGWSASGGAFYTTVIGWISTTSATVPAAPGNGAYVLLQTTFAANSGAAQPTGTMPLSVSSMTRVYLGAFGSGTVGSGAFTTYGKIIARRVY